MRVTSQSNDGGFDASAIFKQDGIFSQKILVQCKRYKESNKIGRPVIDQLRGVMMSCHVKKGIVFTTSDFTKDAKQSVENILDIELISGNEICNLMRKYNLGVKVHKEYKTDIGFIEKFANE